jgi:YHS domain-containing protein
MGIRTAIDLGALTLGAAFLFVACERGETERAAPAEQPETAPPTSSGESTLDKPEPTHAGTPLHRTEAAAKLDTRQTVCPTGARPINMDIWAEHEGKRVYFCSEDCKKAFIREPQKYLSMLPQFGSPAPKGK